MKYQLLSCGRGALTSLPSLRRFLCLPPLTQRNFRIQTVPLQHSFATRCMGSHAHSHDPNEPGTPRAPPTPHKDVPLYSRADVAKHASPGDCWIIIWNKVYNISSWIPKHPGGLIILTKAGGDSSELFESIGHSAYARKHMQEFWIGDLEAADYNFRQDKVQKAGHENELLMEDPITEERQH